MMQPNTHLHMLDSVR